MSDIDSSLLLDMSLVPDTSSTFDGSPVGRFLPVTPVEHIRPDMPAGTPQSASGLLLGLGVAGLFQNDGKPFDGMGLLSKQFVGFERGGVDDMIGDDDEDQYTGPSQSFLQEALLTFSQDDASLHSPIDIFLASESPVIHKTTTFATIPTSPSIPGVSIQRLRDPSVPTISSQMKCKLKGEKATQKGRCVGHTWRP